jgi:hypothetical protein
MMFKDCGNDFINLERVTHISRERTGGYKLHFTDDHQNMRVDWSEREIDALTCSIVPATPGWRLVTVDRTNVYSLPIVGWTVSHFSCVPLLVGYVMMDELSNNDRCAHVVVNADGYCWQLSPIECGEWNNEAEAVTALRAKLAANKPQLVES